MKDPLRYLLPFLILFGCGEKVTQDTDSQCVAPVAEAGSDVVANLGQPVTLDAADSAWCSQYAESLSFTWSFSSVPSDSSVNDSALSDNRSPTAINPTFIPDVVGEYVISLRLDDGTNVSAEDFVVVSVQAGNLSPIADCGGAYSGEIGGLVTLNGQSSMDPEGQYLTYDWSLSGPVCSSLTSADIYNGSNDKPSFVPDCDGMFIVSLVVNDGSQWSDPAICSVDVASNNRTPIADAGESQDLGGCANSSLPLNGFGSYDLDGDPLTYAWSVVTAPTESTASDASFSSTSAAVTSFTWDVPGTYTFQLQVYDGSLWSAPDVVSYTIGDIAQNNRPIANAGENQSVTASGSCESSSSYSSASCSDCPETRFELSAAASLDPNEDALTYEWSETTGTLETINGTLLSSSSAITEVVVPPQEASTTSNTTYSFEFELEVQDCERSDSDNVIITYTCSGN
jgi:hypothetical protein